MNVIRTARIIPFDRYGHVLMGQRRLKSKQRAAWIDFYGGGCNPGEDFSDAALREFHEESGFDLRPLGLEPKEVYSVIDRDGDKTFHRWYGAVLLDSFDGIATAPEVLQANLDLLRKGEEVESIGSVALHHTIVEGMLKFGPDQAAALHAAQYWSSVVA